MFDVLIVPGSVREKERELRAISAGFALRKKFTSNLLLTGGMTSKKSEAEDMRNVILKTFPKLSKNNIFLEENSHDTSANFKNSLKIIKVNKWKEIGILTNSYHSSRAMKIANSYGLNAKSILVEDLLIKYDLKYRKIIKEYYKTNDMKNIFTYEYLLRFLLIFDRKGKTPNLLSRSYYKFIKKVK